MQEDPRLIERALGILDRWMQAPVLHSRPLLQEWQRILQEQDWDLALSKGERGSQLRQASPVSCVLPNKQRLEIIRSCKKAVGEEMAEKLATYDPAEDLKSDEAIAIFMAEAFQTGDAAYIAHALGVVARAKGMVQIAGERQGS